LSDCDLDLNNTNEVELMSYTAHLPLLDDSILAYLNNLNNEQSIQEEVVITTINLENNIKNTSNKKKHVIKLKLIFI
jgi:hypothetical protein